MNSDEDILILRETNGLVSFKIPVEAAALYVRLDPPVSVQCSSVPRVTSIKPNQASPAGSKEPIGGDPALHSLTCDTDVGVAAALLYAFSCMHQNPRSAETKHAPQNVEA